MGGTKAPLAARADHARRRSVIYRRLACDDALALRSVTFGVALSVLTAACALFSEPVPPGTVPVEARITNNSGQEMPLSVVLPTGEVLQGAIQPTTSVPAFSTVTVTVYLPITGDWRVRVGDWGAILRQDIPEVMQGTCRVVVVSNADGSGSLRCSDRGG